MGTQLYPPRGTASSPQFLAHVCCGQMAGWIKVPLGTKIWPRPRPRCVRWGLAPFPPKRGWHPQFSAHVYCCQMVAHLSYCWALVVFANPKYFNFSYIFDITGVFCNMCYITLLVCQAANNLLYSLPLRSCNGHFHIEPGLAGSQSFFYSSCSATELLGIC